MNVLGPNGQTMMGMRQQGGMINQQQVNQPGSVPSKQALAQLFQSLKNYSPGTEHQHQLLQLLKANPQLMASIIKQKQVKSRKKIDLIKV